MARPRLRIMFQPSGRLGQTDKGVIGQMEKGRRLPSRLELFEEQPYQGAVSLNDLCRRKLLDSVTVEDEDAHDPDPLFASVQIEVG